MISSQNRIQSNNGDINFERTGSDYGAINSEMLKINSSTPPLEATTSIRTEAGPMKYVAIAAILSSAFSNSCIFSTYFLLTSPMECKRIEDETRKYFSHTISKSIALGGFAALAGSAQLIMPLIGLVSDCYVPNEKYSVLSSLGKRMPYLILGEILNVLGLLGQMWASSPIHPVTIMEENNEQGREVALVGAWFQYAIFFFLSIVSLNMVYTVMIALIPDLGTYCDKGRAKKQPLKYCFLI